MKTKEYLQNDKYAAHSGIELLSVEKGRAKARMLVKPCHMNAYNTVHGGALFTLADFAFAAACNSHGTISVGINASITYNKAVKEGEVIAVAEEVSLGSKLGSYVVKVYQGEEVVALFQGMAYRKKEPIPEQR